MTDKPVTWEDIPSLQLDLDHNSQSSDKRVCIRLSASDITNILHDQKDVIAVVVSVSGHGLLEGVIADLSHCGAKFYLPEAIDVNARAKCGFTLGGKKIIVDGVVRRVNKKLNFFEIGMEFVAMSQQDRTFLTTITSAKLAK